MSEADDIFGFGPDYADHPSHARPELLRRYAAGIRDDLKRATFEGTEPAWWVGTAANKLERAADLIEALNARATAAEAERDRLRAALERIVAMPGADADAAEVQIARAALAHAEPSGNPGRLPGEENADAQ